MRWFLTLAKLAVKRTHSNSSPILFRNSSTWGRFRTYTWKMQESLNQHHAHTPYTQNVTCFYKFQMPEDVSSECYLRKKEKKETQHAAHDWRFLLMDRCYIFAEHLIYFKELVADIQAKLKLNEKDAVVAHRKINTGLLKALPPSFFFPPCCCVGSSGQRS